MDPILGLSYLAHVLLVGTGYLLVVVCLLTLFKIFHNVYLHPLRGFPGPKSHAATWLVYSYYHVRGRAPFHAKDLHDTYGPVVRISPDALVFTSATAQRDIYARTRPHQNPKDPVSRPGTPAGFVTNMINADDIGHARQRRVLAHAFSAKALEDQEPIIGRYVDLLVRQLRKHADSAPIDMVAWYNFTTFDIIGDLSFGTSFDCLATGGYHSWVATIFQSVRIRAIMAEWNRWIPSGLTSKLLPQKAIQKQKDFQQGTRDRVAARLSQGEGNRPDFVSFMLKNRGLEKEGKVSFSDEEITVNSFSLVLAGSETTATLLSGLTFHLLQNPKIRAKAVQEVRTAFVKDEDITFQSISKLDYLLACLNEGMRVYPPVPGALFRMIKGEPSAIDGYTVPPGTSLGVSQWAANRSSANFARPDEFVPERWLEDRDAVFANDYRDAVQPFSLGPRNCIGRNLAYVEMRLILARVLFNFDMELVEGQQDWAAQDAFFLWQKEPLMVRLKPAPQSHDLVGGRL